MVSSFPAPGSAFLWPRLPLKHLPTPRPSPSACGEQNPRPGGSVVSQSLTWPGASVCLHSHRHPAALPVPLHLLLGPAGGLAPVPSAHGGARRQCWPHALLLHAGLGRPCLHHRYPIPALGPVLLHPEVHLRATFAPPISQAPHPNATGQVLYRCPSDLTWPLRPPPKSWVPHADPHGPW